MGIESVHGIVLGIHGLCLDPRQELSRLSPPSLLLERPWRSQKIVLEAVVFRGKE